MANLRVARVVRHLPHLVLVVVSSSVGLVLIENGKSRILHKLAVQLLELLQGVLVVLAGTFRQDIHPEVGISDLFLVVLLVGRRELVSLPLKFLL